MLRTPGSNNSCSRPGATLSKHRRQPGPPAPKANGKGRLWLARTNTSARPSTRPTKPAAAPRRPSGKRARPSSEKPTAAEPFRLPLARSRCGPHHLKQKRRARKNSSAVWPKPNTWSQNARRNCDRQPTTWPNASRLRALPRPSVNGSNKAALRHPTGRVLQRQWPRPSRSE